jgi:hypothetical protein
MTISGQFCGSYFAAGRYNGEARVRARTSHEPTGERVQGGLGTLKVGDPLAPG